MTISHRARQTEKVSIVTFSAAEQERFLSCSIKLSLFLRREKNVEQNWKESCFVLWAFDVSLCVKKPQKHMLGAGRQRGQRFITSFPSVCA